MHNYLNVYHTTSLPVNGPSLSGSNAQYLPPDKHSILCTVQFYVLQYIQGHNG